MSTSFNPNIPSNDDSVYDAYFSFFRNMEAINNLIGIDHIDGTANNYRGMHRKITFPVYSSPGELKGKMGSLYTEWDRDAYTYTDAPRLKFANANGNWEVLLDKKHYKVEKELTLSDKFEGGGYVQLPRGFVIQWYRGHAKKGEPPKKYPLPKELARIYFAYVFHCKSKTTLDFEQDDDSRKLNGLNWSVGTIFFAVENPFTNTDLNFQLLVLGIAPNKDI